MVNFKRFLKMLGTLIGLVFGLNKESRPTPPSDHPTSPEEILINNCFNAVYSRIEWISFNPRWVRSPDDFIPAVYGLHAPKLEPGKMVGVRMPMPQARKMIIVGTVLGNIVVFQRYPNGAQGEYGYISSVAFSTSLKFDITPHVKKLSLEEIKILIGPPNIGKQMQKMDLAEELIDYKRELHYLCF